MCNHKKTTEQFISEASSVHNNKYNYSEVEYINNSTKINIICNIHGMFSQRPTDHLHGKGCRLCGIERNILNQTKLQQTFIYEAIFIHNNKYDYSEVEYINAKTKVKIICPIHGKFIQTPSRHLNSYGCHKCATIATHNTQRSSIDEYITKANHIHNNKYDYSKVEYKGLHEKINIICPKHGIFNQLANNHIRGHGCPICGIDSSSASQLKSHEQFINESLILNPDYDYSKTVYLGDKFKVTICCPIHGAFEQIPSSHLQGRRCPKCKESKGEHKICQWLNYHNIVYNREFKFDKCKYKSRLPFDFYIPSLNMCIEYDGEHHFKEIKHFGGKHKFIITQLKDSIKTKYCTDNNITLLRIPYTEFDNIDKILQENIKLKMY